MSARWIRFLIVPVALAALLVPGTATSKGAKVENLTAISGESPFQDGCNLFPEAENPEDAEVEVSFAVNPANPKNMIAAWMQDNIAGIVTTATHDGGRIWTSGYQPGVSSCSGGDFPVVADPWLSIGPDGTAYLASFSVSAERTRLQVSRSEDGGLTWSNPLTDGGIVSGGAITAHDKPAVTADPTMPCVAYVVWKEQSHPIVDDTNVALMFSRTDDCGRTWSPVPVPVMLGSEDHFFAQQEVLVLLDATLLTVTSIVAEPDVPGEIVVSRSEDGGESWSDPVTVTEFTWSENPRDVEKCEDPEDPETCEPIHMQQDYAFADVAPDGRVHIAFRHGTKDGANQIRVVSSTDQEAKEWDEPMVVSEGTATKYLPSLAVAGDGTVGITYYDLRHDTPHDEPLEGQGEGTEPLVADVYLAFSHMGGRGWKEQHVAGPFDLRTSLRQSAPEHGYTVGDYHGIDGLPHGFGAAFPLAEPYAKFGATDVFFAEIRIEGGQPNRHVDERFPSSG